MRILILSLLALVLLVVMIFLIGYGGKERKPLYPAHVGCELVFPLDSLPGHLPAGNRLQHG